MGMTLLKERSSVVFGNAHRFSVAQYHRLIEAGALSENDRVELLDGIIVDKMTHNPPHDCTIQLVDAELSPRLPDEWRLRIQSAITLKTSEPEPDIAVVRGGVRKFLRAHPGSRDIGMLIEVAESSLAEDRDVKGPIYARARIPIYWIVNLVEGQIEAYTHPRVKRNAGYAQRCDYLPGASIPLILEDQEIAQILVRDLLP